MSDGRGGGPVPATGGDSLARVAALIRRESGILLPEARIAALYAAIRRTGAAGPDELLRAVGRPGQEGRAAVQRLLDEVTVQETSFLRDPEQLQAVDWQALHAAAVRAGGDAVRVWSAGCATGEEAWSLALLASESGVPCTVLGTDVSAAAIDRARVGRYRASRARAIPAGLHARHLAADGDHVLVGDRLRRQVRFAVHNLVSDPASPAGEGLFDLVVCRNVLIYFDPPTAEVVVARLRSALRPSAGVLLLGAADQLGRAERVILARTRPATDGLPELASFRPEEHLACAVAHADAGRSSEARAEIGLLLARDPLNAGGHFLRGLVELPRDPEAAVASLRRALLIDPRFGLAAFQLGRAYDALGDATSARAAYEQALHTLDPDDERYDGLLRQVDLGDVATAIRVRIGGSA